ncbi:hypothetical protein M405DRAFT_751769, partial [Rhizopogon salebrosus TDB-379]
EPDPCDPAQALTDAKQKQAIHLQKGDTPEALDITLDGSPRGPNAEEANLKAYLLLNDTTNPLTFAQELDILNSTKPSETSNILKAPFQGVQDTFMKSWYLYKGMECRARVMERKQIGMT